MTDEVNIIENTNYVWKNGDDQARVGCDGLWKGVGQARDSGMIDYAAVKCE